MNVYFLRWHDVIVSIGLCRMMNRARNDCCGPPPSYKDELPQDNQRSIKKNQDSDPQALMTNDYPPSYLLPKQNVLPPASAFVYIQPTVLRSWKRFLCTCTKCSVSLDNLAYNLWYFQLNYISVLLTFVLSALFL